MDTIVTSAAQASSALAIAIGATVFGLHTSTSFVVGFKATPAAAEEFLTKASLLTRRECWVVQPYGENLAVAYSHAAKQSDVIPLNMDQVGNYTDFVIEALDHITGPNCRVNMAICVPKSSLGIDIEPALLPFISMVCEEIGAKVVDSGDSLIFDNKK